MIHYSPQKIYVDADVKDFPMAQRILKYYSGIPYEEIREKPSFLNEIRKFSDPISEGKKRLWITKNQGKLVKKCGASTSSLNHLVCCNYFILDFSFNCHFECEYCFLQEYTNLPLMVIYANVEEMLEKAQELIDTTSSQRIRIGTGEMADSLALDLVTGFSRYLVPFFAKQKRALLELKTKSNQVQNLLEMDPKGQTVVAWSINPSSMVQKYDHKTASLKERLKAAEQCEKAGYGIAFHLDPLIADFEWEIQYHKLIDYLLSRFKPVWISLGVLRFNANLKTIIQKRFPRTELTTGEFITTPDGKKRYFRFIREEMYKTIHGYIQKKSVDTPVYLCMESGFIWKNVMGSIPQEIELEKHITRNSNQNK